MKKTKYAKPRSSQKSIWLVVALVVVSGAAWYAFRPAANANVAVAAERPQTLSPALFTDDPKARAAYQVAKDIPEILEQLPCFCGCMSNYGHKNNLFCFSDMHGSGCDLCENIALDANDMHSRGVPIDQIKKTITDRYSHFSE